MPIRVSRVRKDEKELNRALEVARAIYGTDIYSIRQHGASVIIGDKPPTNHEPEALIFPDKRQVIFFDRESYGSRAGQSSRRSAFRRTKRTLFC